MLIVIDEPVGVFRCKLIDLGSVEHIGKPDAGLIFGVTTLLDFVKK